MKQLDVDVIPPANIMTFRPGLILTHGTFDHDRYFVILGAMPLEI